MLQTCIFGMFVVLLLRIGCHGSKMYKSTCDDNKVDIKCNDANKTLEIVNANYGKTRVDLCGFSTNTTNCSLDVSLIMGSTCNGLRACSMIVSESLFGNPCPLETKSVSYVYQCNEDVTALNSATNNEITSSGTTLMTSMTSAQPSLECGCVCAKDVNIDNYAAILSDPELVEQLTKNITKMLKIDRTVLSSTIRKKTSVADTRTSATYVGYVGIVVLVVSFGSLVMMDFTNLFVQRTSRSKRWRL